MGRSAGRRGGFRGVGTDRLRDLWLGKTKNEGKRQGKRQKEEFVPSHVANGRKTYSNRALHFCLLTSFFGWELYTIPREHNCRGGNFGLGGKAKKSKSKRQKA